MWLLVFVVFVPLGTASATASPSHGGGQGVVFSSLRLNGGKGYAIEVAKVASARRTFRSVILTASKGNLAAEYEVPVANSPGIHATFGSRGEVSLAFRRSRRAARTFAPNCRVVTEKGAFRGMVRFAGELGYTAVEASGGRGEVVRFPNGLCNPIGDRVKRPAFPLPFLVTKLIATSRPGGNPVEFTASRLEGASTTTFNASLREKLGTMTIRRSASAHGGKGTLLVARKAGKRPKSAVVTPPAPFQGSATLEQPGSSWTGSLSVDFPGAATTSLAGEGFTANLCLRSDPFQGCRPGVRAQGSGSQSQAFWDTRLSWSR